MTDQAYLIIKEALEWLGTPYKHESRLKGVGCDCIGLVIGVWEKVFGESIPIDIPKYSPDWNDHKMDDPMVKQAARVMKRVPVNALKPSNVIVFRMNPNMAAKHCGILISDKQFIHSYSRSSVRLENMTQSWKRKIVAGFEM